MNCMKNKKIIIIVVASVILFFVFNVIRKEFLYHQFFLISQYDDVFYHVNSNAVLLEEMSAEDIKKLEELFEMGEVTKNDIEFITKISDSFFMGYRYLFNTIRDDSIIIRDLSDDHIAWLIYYFMTSGNESVCIKKEYYQELAYQYFGSDNFKYYNPVKGIGYDFLNDSYCFEKSLYQVVSDFQFYDYDIEVDGWYITLYYYEMEEDSIIRDWRVQFREEDGYYRLISIEINSFSK